GGAAAADENAVSAGSSGVHDPLRDALVVEVRDLLPKVVVLEEGRAAGAGLEGVVRVAQSRAGRGGEKGALLTHVRPLSGQLLARRGDGDRRVLLRLGGKWTLRGIRLFKRDEFVGGGTGRGRRAGCVVWAHALPSTPSLRAYTQSP